MKIALILASLCAMAAAGNPGDWIFEIWTSGKRSEAKDDAMASSFCPTGYDIKSCHWSIYESDYAKYALPDGVKLVDRADGMYCEAYNQAFGKGVQSSCHCIKVLLTVSSDDRPGDNEQRQPIATCPPGYQLLPAGCSLHCDTHHQTPLAAAVTRGNTCTTSPDCLKCKVQARCMLKADSFTREEMMPPPVEGQLKYLKP